MQLPVANLQRYAGDLVGHNTERQGSVRFAVDIFGDCLVGMQR